MTTPYTPPGWPPEVRAPGAPDWEATAVAFLLDCCPADLRGYPVLHRHPVVLAQFAGHFVGGHARATQEGLAEVRTSLARVVPPEVVASAVDAWLEQSAHLIRVRRAVGLIEEALRGRTFVPRL